MAKILRRPKRSRRADQEASTRLKHLLSQETGQHRLPPNANLDMDASTRTSTTTELERRTCILTAETWIWWRILSADGTGGIHYARSFPRDGRTNTRKYSGKDGSLNRELEWKTDNVRTRERPPVSLYGMRRKKNRLMSSLKQCLCLAVQDLIWLLYS